jgi:hypothetical protein
VNIIKVAARKNNRGFMRYKLRKGFNVKCKT